MVHTRTQASCIHTYSGISFTMKGKHLTSLVCVWLVHVRIFFVTQSPGGDRTREGRRVCRAHRGVRLHGPRQDGRVGRPHVRLLPRVEADVRLGGVRLCGAPGGRGWGGLEECVEYVLRGIPVLGEEWRQGVRLIGRCRIWGTFRLMISTYLVSRDKGISISYCFILCVSCVSRFHAYSIGNDEREEFMG